MNSGSEEALVYDSFKELNKKDKTAILISLLIGVSIVLFGITKGFVSILVFWNLGLFTSILQPISSNKINNLVESKQRATIIL